MKDILQKISLAVAGIIILGLGAFLNKTLLKDEELPSGSSTQNKVSYNALGSPTASSTLTRFFEGNRVVIKSDMMENLHLDIRYSPLTGESNRYMEILIEGSNDGGVNFYPMGSKVIGTDEIDLYVSSTTGYPGLPIVMPGNKISVGSTTYHSQYDTDIIADHIRISARESGTSNFGFFHIRASLSSKE